MSIRKKKVEFYKVVLKTLDDKKSDLKLLQILHVCCLIRKVTNSILSMERRKRT